MLCLQIVPPEGWKACRDITKNLKNLNGKKGVVIENPILQEISSTHCTYMNKFTIQLSYQSALVIFNLLLVYSKKFSGL